MFSVSTDLERHRYSVGDLFKGLPDFPQRSVWFRRRRRRTRRPFDEPLSPRHNGAVFGSRARLASALVIGPFLLYGSSLAPVHVHESGSGHSQAVAHSHFEPHHFESQEPDGGEFDHGADRVVWLENAILHQPAYQTQPGPALNAVPFEIVAAASSWTATPFEDVARVHGPPRRHLSFRGPPFPLV
jgi:hypothetical protein